MSNYADTEALSDYYAERPDADFEDYFDFSDEPTDEDYSALDADVRHASDLWDELAGFDTDALPGGPDFGEPPF